MTNVLNSISKKTVIDKIKQILHHNASIFHSKINNPFIVYCASILLHLPLYFTENVNIVGVIAGKSYTHFKQP
jgi:hypothetical protein